MKYPEQEVLQAIYEGVTDGLLIADVETRKFLFANPQICTMLGYTEAELLEMSVKDIHPAPQLGRVDEDFVALSEGKIMVAPGIAVLRRDGSVFYANIAAKQITYQGRRCVIGFFRDVTEQVKTAQALRESEERYRALAESALDSIFIVGRDLRVQYVNTFGAQQMGRPAQELVGQHVDELFPHESFREYRNALVEVLESGKPTSKEARLLFSWGEMWLHIRLCPIRDASGTVVSVLGIGRDITERKRAEVALAESEQKYRALFTDSQEAMSLTIGGRLVDMNPAWLRLHGFTDKAQVLGKDVMEVVHPQDRHIIQAWRNMPDRDIAKPQRMRDVRTDGSVVEVEVYSSEINLAGCRAILTTVRDVTQRILEEQRYTTVLKTALDGFWEVDPATGRILDVNDAYCRLTGYTRYELLNTPIADIDAIESAEDVRQHIARIVKSGGDRFETRHRCKDGRIVDMDVSATYLPIGEGRIFAFIRDITERKATERRLREAEERFRALVEQIPAITYTAAIDEKSTTLYVSPQVKAILGYTQEEYKADPDIWLKRLHPEDRDRVLHEVRRAHTGEEPLAVEYRMITRDGRVIWFRDEGTIVRDADGRPLFLQGVMYDITQQKQTEELLKKSHDELEDRVRERTAELARANEALRESEHKYRLLIENAGMPIFVVDEKGVFRLMNNGAAHYLGGRPEEFIGKNMWELFPKAVADRQVRNIRRVIRTGQGFSEVARTVLQGKEAWFSVNIQPMSETASGSRTAMVIAHDITERIKIETEQKLLLESMQAVLEKADTQQAIRIVLDYCITASESKCGFFGFYNPELGQFESETVLNIIRPGCGECKVNPNLPFLSRGLRGIAIRQKRIIISNDVPNDPRRGDFPKGHIPIRRLLILPVRVRRKVVGLLGLGNKKDEYSLKDAKRLEVFVNQAALAIEHARVQEERERLQSALERLSWQLIHAQEEERRRLSRELHDGLGQDMTAICLALESAKAYASTKAERERLDSINKAMRKVTESVRTIAHRLRPAVLDDFGLVTALRTEVAEFARMTGIKTSLRVPKPSEVSLRPEEETALFRIAQEALTNVARHAEASKVSIELRCGAKSIRMTITDNGKGFSPAEVGRDPHRTTLGLRSIRERARAMGGEATVVSKIGKGTKVVVLIPRHHADEAQKDMANKT